jgi:hypothetical protein
MGFDFGQKNTPAEIAVSLTAEFVCFINKNSEPKRQRSSGISWNDLHSTLAEQNLLHNEPSNGSIKNESV